MSAGDIDRNGDSGNKAGKIKGTPGSVRLHTSHVHSLTAVVDSGRNLKLISWRINHNGSIDRGRDSGSEAGRVASLSLARVFSTFDFYVTAVMDSGGNEKLISWTVNEDGSIVRRESSGHDGMNQINGVSVVGRDDFHNVITGIWDGNKNLILESWRMNQNGHFSLHKHSGDQAGVVQSSPVLIALDTGLLVSVVVTKESTLKLISWRIEGDGSVRRLRDSANQAGKINTLPTAVVTSQGMIVTAIADSASNLKLIVWEVENDGAIHRRGDSGSQAGKVLGPRLSIARNASAYVTAIADSESNLKLISWAVSADGLTIQRKGDSADQAGTIVDGPAIHSSPHSSTGFVTSVPTADENLKLISWTVEPF